MSESFSGVKLVWRDGALNDLLKSPTGPVGQFIQKLATSAVTLAKKFCPVDTGRARASIHAKFGVDRSGPIAWIGSTVDYFRYLEFGTINMPAFAPLRRAIAALKR